ALSLTLSPGGRGNCSAWSAASGVVAGLCLPTELPDSAINAFRQDVQDEHTSPLSLLGRGAGGEGPKSQTSMEPLTGLIARALSLTLSPGGRGNCSAWSAASGVVAGLCLPTELPDSAINAFRQDVQGEHTSPLSLLGRGAGGEGPKSQTSMEPLTGLITCALSPEGEGICGTQLVASAACSSSGLSFSTGCSLSFARESRFRLTSLSTRLADTLK